MPRLSKKVKEGLKFVKDAVTTVVDSDSGNVSKEKILKIIRLRKYLEGVWLAEVKF